MSRLTFITLISIITLLTALGLQYRQQSEKAETLAKKPGSSEPDYYLNSAKSTEFNEQGAVRYDFIATQLQHFPTGDYTLVEDPDVTLYHKSGTPWQISSKRGRITSDNETIKLWDDVWLRRNTPLEPLDLRTRALNIIPKQDLAQTDQDVTITRNNGQVDATGLKAYLKEDRMELLANVRVRHEPVKTR